MEAVFTKTLQNLKILSFKTPARTQIDEIAKSQKVDKSRWKRRKIKPKDL